MIVVVHIICFFNELFVRLIIEIVNVILVFRYMFLYGRKKKDDILDNTMPIQYEMIMMTILNVILSSRALGAFLPFIRNMITYMPIMANTQRNKCRRKSPNDRKFKLSRFFFIIMSML